MRDSLGSITPIVIILSFIILISGILAFSVNYNKAFRMKNQIIYILEKNGNDPTKTSVQEEIKQYAQTIGYSASPQQLASCSSGNNGYEKDRNSTGWCYKQVVVSNDSEQGDKTNGKLTEYKSSYVNVVTFVSVDIPILNVLVNRIGFLQIKGSTKQITTIND